MGLAGVSGAPPHPGLGLPQEPAAGVGRAGGGDQLRGLPDHHVLLQTHRDEHGRGAARPLPQGETEM